jgi:small ligand-binding sensory domain FIST
VLEQLDGSPDLALLFVTSPHSGEAFAELVTAVMSLLQPGVLVAATAVSVIGGRREVEVEPAVSLWASSGIGPVLPVHLEADRTPEGMAISGVPEQAAQPGATLLLIPDPYSFPADAFVEQAQRSLPGLQIIGGLASALGGPGANRLAVAQRRPDGATAVPEVVRSGAVGVLLAPGVVTAMVVSQGCRPVGQPFTVTAAQGYVVGELGGRPALERLEEIVAESSADERALLGRGVHVGRVIDEHQVDFGRGDFLIRTLMGADRARGSLIVGDQVEVGSTLQFQVRDADSADEDLRLLLHGRPAAAALVFTCNGRGLHLFGEPDHDATVVAEMTGAGAIAGMFCAGEIGPVGGRAFLHGFTASVALFGP